MTSPGSLGLVVEVGVDHPHVGCGRCVDGVVDGPRGGGATGRVVVEGEDDPLDADVGEPFEQASTGRCPAERSDAGNAACAEGVDVKDTLDEDDLPIESVAAQVGKPIGDVGAAGCAA
jgi:hypothetical protein